MAVKIPQKEGQIFLASIRHCLRGLLRFSGRDPRALFWPYAFSLFCLVSVGGYIWMMFMMQRIMHFALVHPRDASITVGPGSTTVHFAPGHPPPIADFQEIIVGCAIGMTLFFALIAAAVWRRLHDRGRTGLWGLLPVGFALLSLIGFWRLVRDSAGGSSLPGLFLIVLLSDLAYFGTGLALVIMLAGAGTAGANEFGPDSGAAETA